MRTCRIRLVSVTCALFALSLVAPARSLPAPLAAALGPEVAVGEPSGGYVGHLEVLPTHGPVGTPVTVTADGLPRVGNSSSSGARSTECGRSRTPNITAVTTSRLPIRSPSW